MFVIPNLASGCLFLVLIFRAFIELHFVLYITDFLLQILKSAHSTLPSQKIKGTACSILYSEKHHLPTMYTVVVVYGRV